MSDVNAPRDFGRQAVSPFIILVLRASMLLLFTSLIILFMLKEPLWALLIFIACLTVLFSGMLGGVAQMKYKYFVVGGAPAIYLAMFWVMIIETDFSERLSNFSVDREVAKRESNRELELIIKCHAPIPWVNTNIIAHITAEGLTKDGREKFEYFRKKYENLFQDDSNYLNPTNYPGDSFFPIPVMSERSEFRLFKRQNLEGSPLSERPLIRLIFIDDQPRVEVFVSDNQPLTWGCD